MEEAKVRNQNLRDIALSHEQAVAFGRKGGIASGKARQRRKLLRETIDSALAGRITDVQLAAQLDEAGLPQTHQGAVVYALILKAENGDTDAFRLLRDSVGEKPSTDVSFLAMTQMPVKDMDLTVLSNEELEQLLAYYENCEEEDTGSGDLPLGGNY